MAPPLAGRPPFATDAPDSIYDTSPKPRPRPPPQQTQPNRTSAYDVYDNYLSPGENTSANRNSGIGALGMGFMNADMDDDSDSEDDEEDMRRTRMASSPTSPSKNARLAAATGATKTPTKGSFSPERFETPPPQYNAPSAPQKRPSPGPGPTSSPLSSAQRSPPAPAPSPPAIAAPRPGYATPIAALNQTANNQVARPPASAAPAGRSPSGGLRIVLPAPASPGSPYDAPTSPFTAPSPSSTPHPLQPPVTPITPVFARPQRTATMNSENSVSFSETKGLIMRGDREETLLTRGRGEKGDQFWRRFSMVAKDSQEKKPSAWLKKTQGGANKHRRWVWIVGIILIIAAAGGIGIGVYLSEQASAHYRPDAIGGGANEGVSDIASSTAASHGKSSAKGALATSSELHVSPTNTVARREPVPQITGVAGHAARNRRTSRLEPDSAL